MKSKKKSIWKDYALFVINQNAHFSVWIFVSVPSMSNAAKKSKMKVFYPSIVMVVNWTLQNFLLIMKLLRILWTQIGVVKIATVIKLLVWFVKIRVYTSALNTKRIRRENQRNNHRWKMNPAKMSREEIK